MDKVIYKKYKEIDSELFDHVKKESFDLANRLNWNDGINQILLQTFKPKFTNYVSGSGKLEQNIVTIQELYKYTQEELIGTHIDKLLNSLNVFRSRLMLVPPRHCYSIHKDRSPRLHLALDTNPECLFVFPNQSQIFHIPEDKTIYWTDTRESHTFMNCSLTPRIHLVMCVSQ